MWFPLGFVPPPVVEENTWRWAALVITTRCYASVVYAMALCLSYYLSQVGVLSKQLNVRSRKQGHTTANGL